MNVPQTPVPLRAATRDPGEDDKPKNPVPDKKRAPDKKPPKEGPVRTQMMGEHGDDDLGYDPKIIPVQPIPDED